MKQDKLSKVITIKKSYIKDVLDKIKVKKNENNIDVQNKNITYESNNKRRNFSFNKEKTIKIDIIVLGIILIGIAIYYILSNYHRLGLVLNKNINEENVCIIETMYADSKIIPYNDNILIFENSILSSYDANGKKIWQKQMEQMFEPDIYTYQDYIQVVNKDTGYIYVLNGEYEVCRIKIEDNILSSIITENGISVVEHTSSGINTMLDIYNRHGKKLYSFKIESNAILATYCVSSDMKYLAYAYAQVSGVSLSVKVDVIDIKKNEVKKEVITKANDLIYKMYFEGKMLYALLKDTIMSCDIVDIDSVKTSSFSLEDTSIINLDIYKNKIAYITTNTNASNHELCIAKINSNNVKKVDVSESPNYFEFAYGLVYVCFQNRIEIYNLYGIKIKEYTSDNVITTPTIFNDGKCVAFSAANKVYIFKI